MAATAAAAATAAIIVKKSDSSSPQFSQSENLVKQEALVASSPPHVPVVIVAPALVHVKRSAKHKTVIQGCTVWLGPRTKFNGAQLPQSPWANPFPDAQTSVKEGRYEAYLRTLLLHAPALLLLDSLHGQVLGCGCKHAAPEADVTALLAAVHGGVDAVAAMPKSELQWWAPSSTAVALQHARRARDYGCSGEIVMQLWHERWTNDGDNTETVAVVQTLEHKTVIDTVTLPTEEEEKSLKKDEEEEEEDGAMKKKKRKAVGTLDEKSQKKKKKKERKQRKKGVRNQQTDPLGLVHEGKLWPWPSLKTDADLSAIVKTDADLSAIVKTEQKEEEGSHNLTRSSQPLSTSVRYEDTVYLDEAGR